MSLGEVPVITMRSLKIRRPQGSPFPSCAHYMPGLRLAWSCGAALHLSGTAAGHSPPPDHGRPPPPLGPPSGQSALAPSASAAPLSAVSPPRPLQEVPGSLTGPEKVKVPVQR